MIDIATPADAGFWKDALRFVHFETGDYAGGDASETFGSCRGAPEQRSPVSAWDGTVCDHSLGDRA